MIGFTIKKKQCIILKNGKYFKWATEPKRKHGKDNMQGENWRYVTAWSEVRTERQQIKIRQN